MTISVSKKGRPKALVEYCGAVDALIVEGCGKLFDVLSFGALVRLKRGQKRLTQEGLAELVFSDPTRKSDISRIENGKVKTQEATVQILCKTLEISEDELSEIRLRSRNLEAAEHSTSISRENLENLAARFSVVDPYQKTDLQLHDDLVGKAKVFQENNGKLEELEQHIERLQKTYDSAVRAQVETKTDLAHSLLSQVHEISLFQFHDIAEKLQIKGFEQLEFTELREAIFLRLSGFEDSTEAYSQLVELAETLDIDVTSLQKAVALREAIDDKLVEILAEWQNSRSSLDQLPSPADGINTAPRSRSSGSAENSQSHQSHLQSRDNGKLPQTDKSGDLLFQDEIHIKFSPNLVPLVNEESAGLDKRIESIRTLLAAEQGFLLPKVRLTDNSALPLGTYTIQIHGVEMGTGQLLPEMQLALLSETSKVVPGAQTVVEPVFGEPAQWVDHAQMDEAKALGHILVSPVVVLTTHLLEVVRKNLALLFTRRALKRQLIHAKRVSDDVESEIGHRFLEELTRNEGAFDVLYLVLKRLLEEKVSIRNISVISDSVFEQKSLGKHHDEIYETVRKSIGFQLAASFRDKNGIVPVVNLAPEWDQIFSQNEFDNNAGGMEVALAKDEFEVFCRNVSDAFTPFAGSERIPVLLTRPRHRRAVWLLMNKSSNLFPVVTVEELGDEVVFDILGEVVGPTL